MKKNIILLFCLFQIQWNLTAQCDANVITLKNQTEIDNFASTYSGCNKIIGQLRIDGTNSNITNLKGLSKITSIGEKALGGLTIISTAIKDLSGLDSLKWLKSLYIADNKFLVSVTGMPNINYIESIGLIRNDSLSSLQGLYTQIPISGIGILGNRSLKSLEGLNFANTVGGLTIESSGLTSLEGLNSVTLINGSLVIVDNQSLKDLSGLDNLTAINNPINGVPFKATGNLEIINNSLTSLNGLNKLTSINGTLKIRDNLNLINLSGLNSLSSVAGDLIIDNNKNLNSLVTLSSLRSLGSSIDPNSLTRELSIRSNPKLTSLSGLENVNLYNINSLEIYSNKQLSFCGIKNICDYLAICRNQAYIDLNNINCESRLAVETLCGVSHAVISSKGSTTICQGDSVVLTASGGAYYRWSTGVTSAAIVVRQSNNYMVTVTDLQNCQSTANVEIKVVPKPIVDFGFNIQNNKVLFSNFSSAATNYLWKLGNDTTSKQANPTTYYKNSGTYTVCLIASNNSNCIDSICKDINITRVGIREIPEGLSVKISPNPAINTIEIDLNYTRNFQKDEKLGIIDILGREVLELSPTIGINKTEMSSLTSGIYFLRMKLNGKTYILDKIIKSQ